MTAGALQWVITLTLGEERGLEEEGWGQGHSVRSTLPSTN